jgi:hypothetical protein
VLRTSTSPRTRGEGRKPSVIGPCFCQATGPPVFFFPGTNPRERSAGRRINHSTLARRGARLARHARLSALHRGDFGRRDCSKDHPDRPFGLLIPRASACVRPGAIYQLWRALVVGPGSTPRLPEMACETIRRRRTRSANQDASRWRPRMRRQEQDTERREEKSLPAGDMRG